MNEKPRQAKSIRAQLLTAMREGEYAHCDRLPRESVLSERLGISRTQLRDILASLDREGFITRRHGVGTVINRHVLGAQARMDIEVEFMDMIRQSGRTPGLAFVRAAELPADDRIAAKLGISAGTPLLRISRLCTADGRPAIYCEDMVEKSRGVAEQLRIVAERQGVHFMDAAECEFNEVDFMHLTCKGHARLAELLTAEVPKLV